MKLVALGDTHGTSFWKLIVTIEKPDIVVFIGDYFDSFDFTAEQQCNNFLDIIAFKKANPHIKVIMLIGNHDFHYLPGIDDTNTSGFQGIGQFIIRPTIQENIDNLQMCYMWNNYIFTHAGVGETWLENNGWNNEPIDEFVNDIYRYRPQKFLFTGTEPHGDNMGQTPIWIRPRSLMKDGKNLKKDYIQVVGHTQQTQIDSKGASTGGRYWFIDALRTSGEYMVIEDGKVKINKI
jgi:predicted MPP superfamily phosphohydrolase